MRYKLRSLRAAPFLTRAALAAVLVLSSCGSVPSATEPSTRREAASMEPPPGGLVDSEPNFGWTQGEFSVSQDGAAQYSVPLWVPAGRGAVTPQLSLSYSSRAGNGLLGVGWSLGGLSTISWCARTIAQDGYTDGGHFDGTGALCLNGNRLVPISPRVVAAAGVPHRAGNLHSDHRLRDAGQRPGLLQGLHEGREDPHFWGQRRRASAALPADR